MVTISLCMIVKNEEAVLARCLDSVKGVADEIIIVDTGSKDATKSIARQYTKKIYDFPWIDDFSAARNEAYSKATMDYQMWLDADDVVPEGQRQKLLKLKRTLDPAIDMVTMKYRTHFDEQGIPVLISTRERLTRRERGYRWIDPVHECIPLQGNLLDSDIYIEHRKEATGETSKRNLNIYQAMEDRGAAFTPRQQYYYARELKDHGRHEKAAEYFRQFLDSGQGWKEDNIAACYNLAVCCRILGDENNILHPLLESFYHDSPRAEICCEIGYYYKRREDYRTALQWFLVAAGLEEPDSQGFLLCDYWGYIPNLEACVCWDKLGDADNAERCNEKAALFKPDSQAVQMNRTYFTRKKVSQGLT